MLTFPELCSRLKQLDEVTLLEVLEISSEELVDRFEDYVEERADRLAEELSDEESYSE